jgi:hypothetical protein
MRSAASQRGATARRDLLIVDISVFVDRDRISPAGDRHSVVHLTRWIGAIAAVIAIDAAPSPAKVRHGAAEGGLPRGCPYDFRSDVPRGEYCVYRGSVFAADGSICSDDAVVIWRAGRAGGFARPRRAAGADPAHGVIVGFANAPSFVLRAQSTRRTVAALTDYTRSVDDARTPLRGFTTLGRRRSGRDALTITLHPAVALAVGDIACDFASYRGVFIGVMRGTARGGR